VTSQACGACHKTALAQAAGASHAATLWRTGTLHGGVTTQPTACLDCHVPSEPAPNASTQSSVVYLLTLGATTTNGGQWMNHGASLVAGRDCVVCHQADAKPAGSAWSKADVFHPNALTVSTCANCHGTTNGKGTVIGTNNNLPNGLTNSNMVSASAGVAGTGIPAGALAQITHADVNVTAFDCATCHTQKGTSTAPGVQGKEWAQVAFHSHFTGATALVMNGTTGRCSNCHLSEKPGTAYTAWDHSAISGVSGTQDCSSCHSFPGTGTAAAPNWLGAAGVPTYISVGGFTISRPPATTTQTQAGIANLPHPAVPTGTLCTACHATASGGKHALGYDHASTLITTNCKACHEAGSDLVGTPWNGSTTIAAGAGDTRPFTATALTASFSGNTCNFSNPNHFFAVNCRECHTAPTGIVQTSTGTTYKTRWKFVHTERNMTNPGTCDLCHAPAPVGAGCKKG
jgi:cytochrome c551/c552